MARQLMARTEAHGGAAVEVAVAVVAAVNARAQTKPNRLHLVTVAVSEATMWSIPAASTTPSKTSA